MGCATLGDICCGIPCCEQLFNVMKLDAGFIDRTETLFGKERFARFVKALEEEPVVSIRHNTFKQCGCAGSVAVPWAADGYYLEQRPVFTADPLFHAGCYYVQEASSMFLEQVLKQYIDTPVRMLDLCAAPGGKSTHAISQLPQGSLFVANEPMPLRAGVLAENVIKWGCPSTVVTRNEPADFAPFKDFFDIILVDAPCSGEGMFRKDARAVSMWSPGNVKTCVARQRTILSDIWGSLRPGGLLVYSTCTFNSHEDEEMVAWVRDELGAEVLPVAVSPEWGITGNLTGGNFPVYRFLPGFTRGEGFFLALLRKDGDGEVAQPRPTRSRPTPLPKACNAACSWLNTPEKYAFTVENDTIVAVPREHQTAIAALQSRLKVLHSGVAVAAVKNGHRFKIHPGKAAP